MCEFCGRYDDIEKRNIFDIAPQKEFEMGGEKIKTYLDMRDARATWDDDGKWHLAAGILIGGIAVDAAETRADIRYCRSAGRN